MQRLPRPAGRTVAYRFAGWWHTVPIEVALSVVAAATFTVAHLGERSALAPTLFDLGCCLIVAGSRRFPRATAVAMLLMLLASLWLPPGWDNAAHLVCVFPLFSYRARKLSRLSISYTAGLGIFLAVTLATDPSATTHAVGFLVFWSALIGLAWALGTAFARLGERHAEQARQALHAQKTALARDLHDTVAHKLTQLSLKAQHAQLTGQLDEADLTYFAATASECVDDLRSIVRLLRDNNQPETRWQIPTPTDVLEREVQRLTSHGFRPTLALETGLAAVPREYWATIDGVLAEAVNNVLRHGDRAQPVQILADLDDTSATLAILNTPRDEPPPGGETFGIVGMTERAQAVGGTVTSSQTGAVWTTLLNLPLSSAHAQVAPERNEHAPADR